MNDMNNKQMFIARMGIYISVILYNIFLYTIYMIGGYFLLIITTLNQIYPPIDEHPILYGILFAKIIGEAIKASNIAINEEAMNDK